MKHLFPAASLTLSLLAACAARAQEGSALDRLPENTVGAIVLPDAAAWAQTMAQTTRLGQLINDPKRWEPVWAALEKNDDKGEFKKFRAEMGRLNLKNEDIAALFRHDAGMAVVMLKNPAAKNKPVPMVLVWSGCGQPLAAKFKAALLDPKVLELRKEKIVRTDLDKAMTRLTVGEWKQAEAPKFTLPERPEQVNTPDGGDDDAEGQAFHPGAHAGQAAEIGAFGGAGNAGDSHPDYQFICESGGYLLVGITAGDVKNPAELAGIEQAATAAMGTFTAAQTRPGTGAFSKRLQKSPAVRAVMAPQPGDLPLAQMLLDVPALVQLGKTEFLRENPAKAAAADKLINGLGLGGAGPLAFALTSDPGHFKSRLGWDCPAPRLGLFRLLDQKHTAPNVPAWVGAEVIQYTQYNFDLAGAMDVVIDSIKAAAPTEEDAAQIDGGVAMANGACAAQLGGLKIRDVLAAFGTTHRALSYLPPEQTPEQIKEGGMRRASPLGTLANAKTALVWQEANPEVWRKVMEVIGRNLGANESFVKTQEQGYDGFASKPDAKDMQAGFFLGKNGLVLGLGKDAARTAIAGLNSPAKQNHLLEDCRPAMPLRDAWLHIYGDMRPETKSGLKTLKTTQAELAKNAATDKQKQEQALMGAMISALPTPEQVDEIFSMTASQGWTDAAGLHMDSSVILLPAKK